MIFYVASTAVAGPTSAAERFPRFTLHLVGRISYKAKSLNTAHVVGRRNFVHRYRPFPRKGSFCTEVPRFGGEKNLHRSEASVEGNFSRVLLSYLLLFFNACHASTDTATRFRRARGPETNPSDVYGLYVFRSEFRRGRSPRRRSAVRPKTIKNNDERSSPLGSVRFLRSDFSSDARRQYATTTNLSCLIL